VLAADPELPCGQVLTRWRREQPAFDRALANAVAARRRWMRGRARCSEALMAAVSERVSAGETLAAIGRDPAMPCAGTLYRWMRRKREFREAVTAGWAARAQGLADEVGEIAEDRGRLWGRGREVAGLQRKCERLDGRVERWSV
jgi:hypothetical protein